MLKKTINIKKSYNIIKKIKGCFDCHKIKNQKEYKNMNIIWEKKKYLYKKLYNFKNLKKFNSIMNYITINLKNKFLIEISKYLSKLNKFKNIFLIVRDNFIWRWYL